MRRFLLTIAAAACLVVGCTTGSHIVTGTARPAVLPDAVKIYTKPPEKFESVGIVSAFVEARTGQAATDKALKELKKQAAKIGANGIILGSSGNTAGKPTVMMAGTVPVVTTTGGGTSLSGEAIFVP